MKKKLLRLIIMSTKYSMYGLMISCLLLTTLMAANSSAQEIKSVKEVKVKLAFDQVSLMDVFQQIERATNFHFIFNDFEIDKNLKVSTSYKRGQMLSDILMDISRQANLQFKQVNKNISVKKLPEQEMKNVSDIEVIIQTRTVTGMVTSMEDSEGLPGVNVVEKGSSNGTVTDVQGNYSLEVTEGATLVFSSVGYTQEEVEVGNRSTIDLVMTQDIQQLQELVVVGYGTQRRDDLTGAISSIDSEALKSIPTNSFEQALQGRLAGVQVTQSNAAPGGGLSIRIRGNNSITGNSEPLYVIDGIPIINNNADATVGGAAGTDNNFNALASLNPSDIANIEILKDASATAIYGSRGANGVVIVTTKGGETGKPKVQFDTYVSTQEPVKMLDLVSTEQFATAYNETYDNAGLIAPIDQNTLNQLVEGGGFNYQDNIFRNPFNSMMQNYQLSVSGASQDGLNYYLSGGFFSQDGIVKNTGFDRYSLRLNLEKSFDKFGFGTNFTVSRTITDIIPTDGNNSVIRGALSIMPITPVRDENGDFNHTNPDGDPIRNSVALIEGTTDELESDRLLGSVFGEYEFFDGLTFRTTLGVDVDQRFRGIYFDRATGPFYGGSNQTPGTAQQAQALSTQIVNTNMLTYQSKLNDKNELTVTGVFETQTFERRSMTVVNRGFPSDALTYNVIGSGRQPGGPNVFNSRFKWQLASWVGRVNFIHDNRYLVTLTGRADGSSRFGDDFRWGFFPSVAVAWRVNQEGFMQNVDIIDDLKIRGSWGVTGNQEIGVLQRAERLNPTVGAVFGDVFVPAVAVESFANPELKWEETLQYNFGITSAFLNNRIGLTIDYYYKNTTDLLLNVNLPVSSGFVNRPAYNLGQIKNSGIELALDGNIVNNANFKWNLQANLARNRNEVIEIYSDRVFGGEIGGGRDIPGNLVQEGQPVGVFYGFQIEGVYANEQEASEATVDQSGKYLQEAGEYRIFDRNGDNVITDDDQMIIGDPNPDFIYGLNSSVTFKNLTLDLNFQGVHGNDIVWFDALNIADNRASGSIWQQRFDQRWTPDNPNAEYAKFNANATLLEGFMDSRMIFDGSFLRLRNVSLSYQFENIGLQNINISGLRIYGSISNAFTITNYPGFNPDVNSFGQNAINQGADVGGYPLARSFTLGLNATF